MSLFNPLDSAKDHIAKDGIAHMKGVGTFYWTGAEVLFRADTALNHDIHQRQRKHGWHATHQPPAENSSET